MTIKELCEGERPREKMLARGAFSLSSGELLAVLLRTGRQGESALETAQQLLSDCGGSLTRLFSRNLHELRRVPGIGTGKACALLAAAELGRRFIAEETGAEKRPLVSSRMVYQAMLPRLKGAKNEEFWALYMNKAMCMIEMKQVTSGGGTSVTFDLKGVLKGALDCRAEVLAVVHNHPSGNPVPSPNDIRATGELRRACNGLDLTFADHIIVADDSFYSFAEERRYAR